MTKEYGITETGFYRPTYDELLEDHIQRAKDYFGNDIDTSNLSVLGKYIRINVDDDDKLWQTLEQVYYARFPNTASGVSLERACAFAGITRNPATYARHKILIIGEKGATVQGGFLVSTQNQEQTFYTLEDYVIGQDTYIDDEGNVTEYGYVEADVYAENEGTQGNVYIGAINSIVNPLGEVSDIKHTEIVEVASDIESDYKLRLRFSKTIAGIGATTLEALKASILRVSNVDDVYIRENDTHQTDEYGIPPHSLECFVLCNEDKHQLVAEAIFNKKAVGISTVGDMDFTVADTTGVNHKISFSKATEKKVGVSATIVTNSLFPSDGAKQIATNLSNFLSELKIGENVYRSTLYKHIHIEGVEGVTSLQLRENSGFWNESDVECLVNEVARAGVIYVNGNEVVISE